MPRGKKLIYNCTRCGHKPLCLPGESEKQNLTAKHARFTEMGERARVIRSRVTDWLCINCLENDKDFNLNKNSIISLAKYEDLQKEEIKDAS